MRASPFDSAQGDVETNDVLKCGRRIIPLDPGSSPGVTALIESILGRFAEQLTSIHPEEFVQLFQGKRLKFEKSAVL
jgi:hypothetical protein